MIDPSPLAAALLAIQAPASAPVQPTPRPYQSLLGCRQMTDASARLACFDAEVAAFESARAKAEVQVVDREQIRQSRRSLFGLTLPQIPLLGVGNGELTEIFSGTIRTVRETRDGKWIIGIDEAIWQTTEVEAFSGPPPVGSDVTIRRGSFGSFVLTGKGRRGLRAVRLR